MIEWSSSVIAVWLGCFPEKPSWCRTERVFQGGGAKCKAF